MTRLSLFALTILIASTTHSYAAEGPQERNLDKAIAEMQMHQHTNDAYADPLPVTGSSQSATIEPSQDVTAEPRKTPKPDGDSDGR